MGEEFQLDETAFVRLRRIGGDAFLKRSIDRFLEYAPKKMEALRTGLAAGELITVERAAHQLKPSAGNFGANRLQELAEEIETLAAAGESDRVRNVLPEFEALFVQVKSRLEVERNRIDG